MFIIWKLIIILLGMVGGAYLWYLGGQGKKWARTFAFPGILALLKILISIPYFSFWNLLYMPALMGLIMLFSYGSKTLIHKFWVLFFGGGEDGSNYKVEIATRATCGFFWSLAGVFFVLGGGNILIQIFYTIFLTIANGLIGGLVKNVKISEPAVGAAVSCSLFI